MWHAHRRHQVPARLATGGAYDGVAQRKSSTGSHPAVEGSNPFVVAVVRGASAQKVKVIMLGLASDFMRRQARKRAEYNAVSHHIAVKKGVLRSLIEMVAQTEKSLELLELHRRKIQTD